MSFGNRGTCIHTWAYRTPENETQKYSTLRKADTRLEETLLGEVHIRRCPRKQTLGWLIGKKNLKTCASLLLASVPNRGVDRPADSGVNLCGTAGLGFDFRQVKPCRKPLWKQLESGALAITPV